MLDNGLFPTDGDFRQHIIDYIRENYADVLGEHKKLLDKDGGLEEIMDLVRGGVIGPTI